MISKRKNEEPIEIIVIDSDSFVVNLINMLFVLENVDDIGFIGFDNSSHALDYLVLSAKNPPKIILFEVIKNSGIHDYTFLEEYALLNRNDFIYILTVSIDNNDQMNCMSYDFVKKYIAKPIEISNIRDLINEHGFKRVKRIETK